MINAELIITTLLLLAFFGVTLWLTIRSDNRQRFIIFPLLAILLIVREVLAIYGVGNLVFLSYQSEPILFVFIVLTGIGLIWNLYSTYHSENQLSVNFPAQHLIDDFMQKMEEAEKQEEIFLAYSQYMKEYLGDVTIAVYELQSNANNAENIYVESSRNCREISQKLEPYWSASFFQKVNDWLGGHKIIALNQRRVKHLELSDFTHNDVARQYVYLADISLKQKQMLALIFSCRKGEEAKLHTVGFLTAIAARGLRQFEKRWAVNAELSQYNTIMNSMYHLVGYKNDKNKWKFFNHAARNFFNISYENYYNRTNMDLRQLSPYHDEVFSFFELHEIRCWQENRSITKKKKIQTGLVNKTFEVSFIPAYAKSGARSATVITAKDITKQEKTYNVLKASESQFRELIMQMPIALMIVESNTHIEYVNREFTAIYGYELPDIYDLSTWFEKAYPDPAYRTRIIKDWQSSRRIRDPRYLYKVFSVRTKQGKTIRTRIRWSPLSDDKICYLLEDISREQMSRKRDKQTQQNLIRLSHSALELITVPSQEEIFEYIGTEITNFFDDSVVLFNMIDKNSKYAYLHRYFGISHSGINQLIQILGRDPYQLFFRINAQLRLLMLKGKLNMLKRGFELLLEELPIGSIKNIRRVIGGNYLYIIGLVREGIVYGNMVLITKSKVQAHSFNFVETFMHQASIAFHQKELEKELIRAKEKAEESDKLKSAFLANMSHEVRTPMNSIVGFSELLSSPDYSEDEKQNFVELINDNSRQLMKLITDIVDISKIEAGQISLEYSQVDLNKMMDNLRSSFKNELSKREKTHLELVVKKGHEDRDFVVLTDEYRLKQILMNLINNALKFTNKGFVEFGYTKNPKGNVQFHVRDTGLGIDPINKDVIFERFRQGTDTEIMKNSGTGLGLSISKGLVELMKGSIWFESLKFKGTTFYFELPLEEVRTKKIKPNEGEVLIIDDWGERSILIVEDHEPSYLYMKRILEKTQVNVVHAENANKAIRKVMNGEYFDLILMDIRTPEGNGIEATRKIKEKHPDVRIVAQTAYAMQEDQQRCMDAGCDDYLVKPFTKDQLLSVLDKFL